MSQLKTTTWTNPNPAVARNESVGFAVARVQTIDITNGGSWMWVYGMPNGYYITLTSGAVTTSNGWTPLSQNALFGAPITGISNAADAVFTCSNLDQFSFAVGDTVKAVAVADDGTATTLNGTYTVNAVTATTVTCDESTSAASVYVSGGYLYQVSDANGNPYPTNNVAIDGGTIGTGMVGAASASMVAVFEGANAVV